MPLAAFCSGSRDRRGARSSCAGDCFSRSESFQFEIGWKARDDATSAASTAILSRDTDRSLHPHGQRRGDDMRERRSPPTTLALALLALLGTASRAAGQAAQGHLQELERRLDEERENWLEFRRQAASEAERTALVQAFPRDEFVDELTAIAGEAKDSEVAARAWLDIFRLGGLLDDRDLYARGLEH